MIRLWKQLGSILLIVSSLLHLNDAKGSSVDFLKFNVVEGKISNLVWDEEFSRLIKVSSGLGNQYRIRLFGSYSKAGWTLTKNGEPVSIASDGVFSIHQTLTNGKNFLVLEANGPSGEKEKEVLLFLGPDAPLDSVAGSGIKRFFIFPGIGYSSITTQQNGISDYQTTALTAKLAFNYRLKPNVWDLGFSGFGTVYQFTQSSSIRVRYLGLNARVGYLFQPSDADLFISLYGGWYYASMLVDGNQFGFQNVGGPQIYPAIRYALSNDHVLTGYFKYSPIASSFALMTLSSREIAAGIGYVFLFPNEKSISIQFDFSDLNMVMAESTVKTKSYTLGVQYGF
jgi:hypothetical protein